MCIISINAAPGFNIVEDFANITQQADSTASGSFAVNNTGTTNLDINFTGYTLTKGSDKLNITSLSNITNRANGTSQSSTFSVIIPKQQSPGLYSGTLTATSNASTTDAIKVNLNVTEKYDVSFMPSQIELGSVSLNTTHTRTFNVTNTGNADLTNVTFDFSVNGFNLKSNKTNFVLPFDKTESISFNITIPASTSTGNVTLGKVKIVSTELTRELVTLLANVGGGLTIEDLDVFLTTRVKRSSNGILRSESGNDLDVTDGRKLNFGEENAGPGSELRFNFNIQNAFTDKEDIDINDVSVRVTIEEIDEGEGIEEESNEFDLDAEANEEVNIILKIPLGVEAGLYDILIEAEGEDDSGNAHTDKMRLKLDVDKEPREVIVEQASLFPEKIKCSGTSTLTATIRNIGSRIEDKAMIEIVNKDIGINFAKRNIELEEDPFDEDNKFTQSLIVTVDKSMKPGTYPIEVRSYLQEDALWEKKTANLEVESCGTVAEEQPKENESSEELPKETEETGAVQVSEGTEEEATESEKVPVLGPTTTTEVPLTKKPGFWVAVVLLNLIVIGGVGFFVVKLIKKK
ncbi:MAG TPA: hypothetical protein VI894_02270 [Candidatus Nanoarchaeia archaeon]|nr:hypothetical protein [Candidatus Nanoarchaeia archaeon]